MNRQTQDMSQSVPLKFTSNRCRTGITLGCGILSSISPLSKGTRVCSAVSTVAPGGLILVLSWYGVTEGVILDSRIISLIEVVPVEALDTEAIISFSSSTGLLSRFRNCADVEGVANVACLGLLLPLECTPGKVSRRTVKGVTGILRVDRACISISFSILFNLFSSASWKDKELIQGVDKDAVYQSRYSLNNCSASRWPEGCPHPGPVPLCDSLSWVCPHWTRPPHHHPRRRTRHS